MEGRAGVAEARWASDRCTLLVQDQIAPAGSTRRSLVISKGCVTALADAPYTFANGGLPSCRVRRGITAAHGQNGSMTVSDVNLLFLCHLGEMRVDK